MTEERTVFDDFEYKGRKVDLADMDYSRLSDDVLIERFNTLNLVFAVYNYNVCGIAEALADVIRNEYFKTKELEWLTEEQAQILFELIHTSIISEGHRIGQDIGRMQIEMQAELYRRGLSCLDVVGHIPSGNLYPYCDKEEEE